MQSIFGTVGFLCGAYRALRLRLLVQSFSERILLPAFLKYSGPGLGCPYKTIGAQYDPFTLFRLAGPDTAKTAGAVSFGIKPR